MLLWIFPWISDQREKRKALNNFVTHTHTACVEHSVAYAPVVVVIIIIIVII